ncbi:hypothetical protein FOZ61_002365 [Perkinsus olseni]|uniref:Uncharacterized protein n=1 Tax=Perkinsus olseni TaxID=32597 RepID=A0A7J6KR84_PEROL|nr:hypothetical protein FOZ61_002365 [Perkinsus olseni]KAF4649099.1 hypothetical protein FOL46_002117 [Perkinsus olseni]
MARVTNLLLHLYCLLVTIEYCNASCLGWFNTDDDQQDDESEEYQDIVIRDPAEPGDGSLKVGPGSLMNVRPDEKYIFEYMQSSSAYGDDERVLKLNVAVSELDRLTWRSNLRSRQ